MLEIFFLHLAMGKVRKWNLSFSVQQAQRTSSQQKVLDS